MRVGIDARMYGPLTRGNGRYILETIKYLEKIDTQNEYVVFLHSENFDDYQPSNPNFIKTLAPWRWYSYKEQLFFPTLIKKQRVDLMHFPHFNVPYFYKDPYIVTIHDLILMKASQQRATTLGPLKYKIKKFFYKKIIKNALNKSEKIIAVSECTKKDISEIFHINQNKISTIYEGVSATEYAHSQIDNDAKIKYNYNRPYLIYVGSAYPHKNLEPIIKVVDDIKINLILVGKKDFFYKRLENENKNDFVHFLGYVKDKDLAYLFQNALAYIFPSKYEGFGLPPLEAMINGCPVISSNASCLPEILDDAALYFNPNETDEIKKAINKLISDNQLREGLIKKGYIQAQKYSWEKSAKQTHQLYLDTNA